MNIAELSPVRGLVSVFQETLRGRHESSTSSDLRAPNLPFQALSQTGVSQCPVDQPDPDAEHIVEILRSNLNGPHHGSAVAAATCGRCRMLADWMSDIAYA
jgi:hypothetical protein